MILLAAVTHAVIDNMPHPEAGFFGLGEARWVAIGAIVSALATLATAIMVWFTRTLAIEARSDHVQTESHHQQLLSPFCVLRDATSHVDGRTPTLVCKVQNLGKGPAVYVNLRITPVKAGLEPAGLGMVHYLGPLLDGEISHEITPGFEGWGGIEPSGMFLVRIEFENIFGAWGFSEWTVTNFLVGQLTLQPADPKIKSTIQPKKSR